MRLKKRRKAAAFYSRGRCFFIKTEDDFRATLLPGRAPAALPAMRDEPG